MLESRQEDQELGRVFGYKKEVNLLSLARIHNWRCRRWDAYDIRGDMRHEMTHLTVSFACTSVGFYVDLVGRANCSSQRCPFLTTTGQNFSVAHLYTTQANAQVLSHSPPARASSILNSIDTTPTEYCSTNKTYALDRYNIVDLAAAWF